ncbi:hypothetical protein I8920_00515 [Curtobacterium sp. YC1]|uniref:hypothetical protein n=1 Tax=Curtobacterium sp. YC1 TaxID=2795488 RepID=UPI0018E541F8|nr:hypothetical protein [Curtobacterium sp. YC1]QQD76300.1 hypothetical protein I8920_00515 [Curtobacterium sp. YC1]
MGARARTRSAAALATALGVLLTLAACTLSPPPPTGSESALAKLITRVERLPGVDTAEGEIRQVDAKDDPHDWIASLEVQADTTDLGVAERIRRTAAQGVTGTTLTVSVDVPRGRASAPVAVDPMDPDVVDLAGRLRAEPFVHRLVVTPHDTTITLVGRIDFAEATALARPIIAERAATLDRGDISMGITATQPGPALLRAIDGFQRDPGVDRVSYSPGTTYAQAARADAGAEAAGGPTGAGTLRSYLAIDARAPGTIARVLATTEDEAADAREGPRTAYHVGLDGPGGWLGLPLDAREPDDQGLDEDTVPPAPSAHPWTPADVDDRAATLRRFLLRSAETTGVPATVDTAAEPCTPTGTSDASGTRATASTVVPVFTVMDDAQVPFDAVTALWTSAGLAPGGRAMGRDDWSSTTGADPASASIRGTADGLSLTAESVCVP